MKRIFKYIALSILCAGLVSCDKFFDSMEGDLSKVDAETMVSTQSGLLSLLANLYNGMPMNAFPGADDRYQMFANGSRDVPAYGGTIASFWGYGQIRAVNKFLEALESAQEKGVIDEDTKKAFEGEGLFIRAYCYFCQVRYYGGIPIVDHSLDEEYDGGENLGLYFPRSTEKESWDWVLEEFQKAANLLPASQAQEMRVNKFTALGMKARAALWAASESKYWDRAPINASYNAVQKKLTYMEKSYADDYYAQAISAAGEVISSGAYKLYGANPSSIDAAKDNLIEMFQHYKKEEGLLGRTYESGDAESNNGVNAWSPNQCVDGYRTSVYALTLNLVDEYDYYASQTNRSRKDGKIQTLENGNEDDYFEDAYGFFYRDKKWDAEQTAQAEAEQKAAIAGYKRYNSVSEPFQLKDARFQAWVLYPGATFRKTTIYFQGGYVDTKGLPYVYPDENKAVSKNGQSYYPYGGELENNSGFYKLLEDTNSNNRSFYCFTPRKYLDQDNNNNYTKSPWYDLRYAEVLLTYAEAVVESKKGDEALAAKCLNDVRHRAGFTDDIELNLNNVLHEWKVEFAMENKWADVLWRRRAYYNPDNTPTYEEGSIGHKLTLIPMVDLSGSSVKYIFLRALPYSATSRFNNYSGDLRFKPEQYYGTIPNPVKNRIDENNK